MLAKGRGSWSVSRKPNPKIMLIYMYEEPLLSDQPPLGSHLSVPRGEAA